MQRFRLPSRHGQRPTQRLDETNRGDSRTTRRALQYQGSDRKRLACKEFHPRNPKACATHYRGVDEPEGSHDKPEGFPRDIRGPASESRTRRKEPRQPDIRDTDSRRKAAASRGAPSGFILPDFAGKALPDSGKYYCACFTFSRKALSTKAEAPPNGFSISKLIRFACHSARSLPNSCSFVPANLSAISAMACMDR